ncbi:hypothetical protein BCR35DRAFT_335015 [Leucosporidium creatinivorum]|uniref:Uncharacterized protein n=1 Tax=Leucosporidium creatinivorum TaxID=106004 RepID=A0A1Y2DM80_9BASI|nr:hypothetical protein BCR35DRAFT_335015 [Leucosporidium creatinivorum]
MAPSMLPFILIDTMTTKRFSGNPTPVFIFDDLPAWPSERALQQIASEMNQSETAFVRRLAPDKETYLVRWFTPFAEEFLCGHGLLAAVIGLHLKYGGSSFTFITSKGTPLSATLANPNDSVDPSESSSLNPFASTPISFNLTFPLSPPLASLNPPYRHIDLYASALNLPASAILSLSRDALNDVIIELRADVDFSAEGMEVDAKKLVEASPEGTRSQVLTSRCVGWAGNSGEFDFAKRVFAYGSEDQATGSTYSSLGPFWAEKLVQKTLNVIQPSHRGGRATITVEDSEIVCRCSGLVAARGEIAFPEEANAQRERGRERGRSLMGFEQGRL